MRNFSFLFLHVLFLIDVFWIVINLASSPSQYLFVAKLTSPQHLLKTLLHKVASPFYLRHSGVVFFFIGKLHVQHLPFKKACFHIILTQQKLLFNYSFLFCFLKVSSSFKLTNHFKIIMSDFRLLLYIIVYTAVAQNFIKI